MTGRMWKKAASGVLASFRGSPYCKSTIRLFFRCGLGGRPFCASSGLCCKWMECGVLGGEDAGQRASNPSLIAFATSPHSVTTSTRYCGPGLRGVRLATQDSKSLIALFSKVRLQISETRVRSSC
ncbi:MAG: hypothetical protein DYH03_14890 [Nitrospira sp. NTP1]|nr:hypothetical protein [Nitrospira sp. NTP1]